MKSKWQIKTIRVGERQRKHMGDMDALVASMRDLGLLQPILVDFKSRQLIAGGRRLEAAKMLGWEEIDVHPVTTLADAFRALKAERDENVCRKGYTPTEAVDVADRLAELLKPAANERKREGGRRGGKIGGRGRNRHPQNLRNPNGTAAPAESAETNGTAAHAASNGQAPDAGETREQTAEAVGMSRDTLAKAKEVKEAAEDNPEIFGEIAAEMDRTGNVNAAHKKMKKIKEPPPPDPPPPRYPHSDRIKRWIDTILGEYALIHDEFGGIGPMLAEHKKWDWVEVKNYIIPQLSSFVKSLGHYEKEIEDHAKARK